MILWQSRTGSNCKVIEPRYGYQFDLTSLIKKDGDYHVKSGDYDYIVNVCGPLVNPAVCGTNASGVGACQTKPSSNPLFVPVNAGLSDMSCVPRKLGLMHVLKVLSHIGLCSLHRLIKEGPFSFNGNFQSTQSNLGGHLMHVH